jgi:nitrate/TMAO reductase-like tetraheme cytochrome c subunit
VVGKKQKLILIGILGVVILGLAAFSGIKLTSTTSFCSSCHIMDNNYASWQQSTHKAVNCLKCHAEPGFIGTAKVKLNGVKQVAVTALSLADNPGKAIVGNSICTQCHNQENKELTAQLEKTREERTKNRHLVFDHTKHNQFEAKCTSCHLGVGHSDKTDPKVVMTVCLDCHAKTLQGNKDAKTPKAGDCLACHKLVEEITPKNHQPKGKWAFAHGATALTNSKDCTLCHQVGEEDAQFKQGFCFDCHKTAMPHVKDFRQVHSAEYKTNPGVCSKCHVLGAKPAPAQKANNCTDCHAKNPHQADWKDNHKPKALKDIASCGFCHAKPGTTMTTANFKQTTSCASCHVKNPHQANWKDNHKSKALKDIASCGSCHAKQGTTLTTTNFKQTTLCASCHAKNPHPGNWMSTHELAIKAKPESCGSCHKQQNFCSKCHG